MSNKNPRIQNAVYEMTTLKEGEQMLPVDDTTGGVQLDVAKIPEDTRAVQIQCQVADVRITQDDSAPVAGTHGELLYSGERVYLKVEDAKKAKFIREGGTSAVIHARAKSY